MESKGNDAHLGSSDLTAESLAEATPVDPQQAIRLAEELEALNLKLHGGEHNAHRPAILCGAAALRLLAAGVKACDCATQPPAMPAALVDAVKRRYFPELHGKSGARNDL